MKSIGNKSREEKDLDLKKDYYRKSIAELNYFIAKFEARIHLIRLSGRKTKSDIYKNYNSIKDMTNIEGNWKSGNYNKKLQKKIISLKNSISYENIIF